MDSSTGYFWYSQKQQGLLDNHTFCKLDNGKVVEYSEWTQTVKYTSKWDDVKFLGHGTYHHSVRK